jgi:hypothetical protein
VGRVSEGPTRCHVREEQSSRPRQADETVEGIPVLRKTPPFAGWRRNEDLGRSVGVLGGSSSEGGRAGDTGCPLVAEEGNSSRTRTQQAHAPDASVLDLRLRLGRRVLRSVQGPVHVIYVRDGIAVGQTCVEQEEPAPGSARTDVARLVARHCFLAPPCSGTVEARFHRAPARRRGGWTGSGVARKKRMEVAASLPTRIVSSGLVARTS